MTTRAAKDSFGKRIRPYVSAELESAAQAEKRNDHRLAFSHLERAHVLGQASTREHVRVHWQMLLWGIRHRAAHEVFGQIIRIVGAATKTAFGLVPVGNTGGSNVSAIKPLPIPADLAAVLAELHPSEVRE